MTDRAKESDGIESFAMDDSARMKDINGFIEIKRNPISRSGLFEYDGSQIPGGEPGKVYVVYRSPEELGKPETVSSFRLVPFVDDHPNVLLGPSDKGLMPAERKGVQGVTGEEVEFDTSDGVLYSNIKLFTDSIKGAIDNDKIELSIGFRCKYVITDGIINGQRYNALQYDIRGNHLALVDEGRAGPDVAVLDALDSFTIALDAREFGMADKEEPKKEEPAKAVAAGDDAEAAPSMSMDDVLSFMEKVGPQIQSILSFIEKLKPLEEKEHNVSLDDAPAIVAKAGDECDDEEGEAMDKKLEAVKADAIKQAMDQIAARDDLADKLSKVVGAFDHKRMDLAELAKYGVDKLELAADEGEQLAVLKGYLQHKQPQATFALDAAKAPRSNAVDSYIQNGAGE